MNKKIALVAMSALIAGFSLSAQAHRAWIVPAATVLSGDDPWVTFDAAASNDIFHADHAALGLGRIKVTAPDGSPVELQNAHSGKYRSTFDLNLKQQGTYRIFSNNAGLRAQWETKEGVKRFWPRRKTEPTAENFAKDVPKDAKNLKVMQSSYRLETFVTVGSPSKEILQASGTGLELVPITHPNDLIAGEAAEFQFLIDGKPAVGAEVEVIAGGMRYRNKQDKMTLKTDDNGKVKVLWPQAGMYWLHTSYRDDKAQKPATERRGSYSATFEVLPE